jgi:hypothetical protein
MHYASHWNSTSGNSRQQASKTSLQIQALDNAVKEVASTNQKAFQLPEMAGRIQPLALIDKCIGSRIWIILKVKAVNVKIGSYRQHLESFSIFITYCYFSRGIRK